MGWEQRMSYNTLKIRVLSALENRAWINPAMISRLSGLRPARSVSTYMEHLRGMRLVLRRRRGHRLVLYSISKRGRERLAWLRRKR